MFSAIPRMSYSHEKRRLNIGVDDLGSQESWCVKFDGVYADDEPRGTNVSITEAMTVEVTDKGIVIRDSATGLNLVIK